MKASFKFFLAALAATAALVGCVQEITPRFENDKVAPAAEGSRIIAVSFAPQTKTELDGFQPKFVDNDSILISNGVAIDTCEVKVESEVATISTNLTGPLTAVYPYKAAKMNDNNHNLIDTVLVSTVQDGTFASANICMARMTDENEESLSFENKTAVFCIKPPTNSPEYVEVSAEGFDIANDYPEGSTYTTCNTIHVAPINTDSVYVSILVPDGLKVSNLKFYDGTNEKAITTGAQAGEEIAAGTLYTVTNANWESTEADIPDGALKGVFSVSADKQVYFSQGNLRYVVNTQEWGFYEQQYGHCNTSTYNGRHSDTVSLFTWGYDAEKSIVPNGNEFDNVSRISDNFEQAEDWGCTIGDCNTWRTLTTSEWSYLFYSRSHTNDLYKYGVTVCGSENCVVLLPDNWAWDANTVGTGWQNDYPATSDDKVTWQTMEEAGAVCLPAAGYRNGSSVDNIGGNGCYWSSTAYDSYYAYFVDFYSNLVSLGADGGFRLYGFSVRLVTDVSAAPTPTPTEPDYVEITAKYDGEDQPARALKWATKNLGAENETDYGKYYAWGDIEGQAVATSGTGAFATAFNWDNCPFNNGLSYYDETYFNSIKNTICPDGILAKDYDVANKVLGGTWRMPTKEEFDALCSLTKTWKTDYNNSGINGYLFTDKNGNSIFLPAAGYGDDTDFENVDGIGGCYWSSSLEDTSNQEAYYLCFTCEVGASTVSDGRFYGHPVRPVSD